MKRVIDWNGIARDFRDGNTSIRQIADWYHVSEGAVRKRAKAENWSQLQRPDDSANAGTFGKVTLIPAIESEHEAREVFTEGRSLALRMIDELSAITSSQGWLEDAILEETSDEKNGRRRIAMMRAIDLPNRAKTLKDLMLAAKTAVEVAKMERADGTIDVSPKADGAKPDDDWDHLLN